MLMNYSSRKLPRLVILIYRIFLLVCPYYLVVLII